MWWRSSMCCMLLDGTMTGNVTQGLHLPSARSDETDRRHPELAGLFEGAEHVRGISAAADPERHVPAAALALDLLGVDLCEIDVVPHRQDDRNVVGEGVGAASVASFEDRQLGQVLGHVTRSRAAPPPFPKKKIVRPSSRPEHHATVRVMPSARNGSRNAVSVSSM